ncbi:MAG: hypothetical protein ACUVWB_10065, partial [Anaerolineae bacterium]
MRAERIGEIAQVESRPHIYAVAAPEAGILLPLLRQAQEIVRRHVEALVREAGIFDWMPADSSPCPLDAPLLTLQPGAGGLLNPPRVAVLGARLGR